MQKIYCHSDMRALKFLERFTSTQVHALNPVETSSGKTHGGVSRAKLNSQLLKSFKSNSKLKSFNSSVSVTEALLLPYGLPSTDLIEPTIEPHLKPIDFVEILADLYQRLESCESQSDRSLLFVEQYSLLRSLGDPKLLRRCLRAARQNAVDVNSKVVFSAWLRFERREDELSGMSAMDCGGQVLECPKIALEYGYDPNLISTHCQCDQDQIEASNVPSWNENECVNLEQKESDVTFCIGNEEINCVRCKIAMLSSPLKTMLYGSFKESRNGRIDFSENGISVKGMRAVEVYSRTRRLDLFSPGVVGELLCFANRFCCEEMKSACDVYLASMVDSIDDALVLIEYGLEEMAFLLVAACLQVLLREFPNSLYDPKVMKFLCSSKTRERLAMAGHGSFLLYYFLSHVAMEESMVSTTTVMLLERLEECATQRWQKTLALHQLGCVLLERREFKDAQYRFLAAVEAGHVYSVAGVARTKYKQGQQYSAYTLMSSIISEYKPAGWMYQERSLYNIGKEKISDLSTATELDPTLSFPYKYRAIAKVEEKQISGAITEIDKTIRFKLSPDCIELRAWFFLALADYESALRDIHVLLTLEPNYMMFHGKTKGDYLVELLSHRVKQMTEADCWMHLYDQWSSVDDIGSLAIIHQMLRNDPGKSLLLFRQSLLLLRLNCQKAAMRSLRLARNNASSDHERLVYEGWILYDTGNREQALSKAEKSIHTNRSFEAFFLKAYVLADASLDPESSSHVIQLLEEALKCPSDGLRKGQALNNLGSIYVDCGKLEEAANSYLSALDIKHTRAHQGLARVYHLKNQRKAAYEEMTMLIEKAQTGTGKTLAFGIPILDKIIQYNAKHGRGRNPLALVLAPTRELAKQVDKEFYETAPSLDTICVYGGTPIGRQMGQLDHGVDVAVGTPGRVIDLLKRGALNLSEVQFVVLDEADQMLQVGFQEDVEIILERLPKKRQTLLFSATMPTWIKNLTRNYLTNPAVIDLVGDSDQKLPDGISLYSIAADSYGKASIIGPLITEHAKGGKCIVFTQTKRDADRLASAMGRQYNCEALHGDISQQQRERTLSGFRDGRFNILVATDVAARGLDVPNVDLVIHYELPNNSEIFVHRSGRTGRAGKKGSAILIYSQDQTRNVRLIERDVGCRFTELPHIAVDSGSADMFDIGSGGQFNRFGGPGGGGPGFGRSGPGGRYNGPNSGRFGSFGDSGQSSTGRGGNFGNSGFGRSSGFENSDRSGGFGNSDRSGGFGSSDRSGGFGSSGHSSGFGSSGRSSGFGGGFGSSDRPGGFGSSDRSGGFGGGFGSSDRSGGFRDRSGGSRNYGLDRQSGFDDNNSSHFADDQDAGRRAF